MNTILSRYFLREQIAPLVIGLFLFTFVLLSNQMLRAVEFVAGASIPLSLFLKVIFCFMPHLFLLTVPMSCLLAVLLTYGRMSEQNEIQAMMAGGVSYFRMLLPALLLGFCISVGLFFWADAMIPRAHQVRQHLEKQILQSLSSVGIQEGIFVQNFPGLVFYTKNYDSQKSEMQGILVFQMDDDLVERMILSPRGRAHFDPQSRILSLELDAGSIYQPFPEKGFGFTEFGNLRFHLDVQQLVDRLVGREIRSYPGLSRKGIRRELEEYSRPPQGAERRNWVILAAEYHRRASLPAACMIMMMVAAPLGILMGQGKRTILFIVSLGLITGYYFLLAGGVDLAHEGYLSPGLGIWMPNILMTGAAVLLNLWASKGR